jgi:hypothetical protein
MGTFKLRNSVPYVGRNNWWILHWTKWLGGLFDLVQGSWRANGIGTGSCSHLLSEYHTCQARPEHNTPIVLPRLQIQGKKGSAQL